MTTDLRFGMRRAYFNWMMTGLLEDRLDLKPVASVMLGDLIPGGGGIRKVRWNLPDTGKKGGIRVIYYWAVSRDQIYLLLLYKKTVKENIDPDQLEILRQLVKGEFK